MVNKKIDVVSMMIEFEMGFLSNGDIIDLFQELIDTGQAWELQGHYGRTADDLIDAGYCTK